MVFSPLLFLGLLELALALAGVGYPVSFFLPATINGQEVLVQNDRVAWRFLGRAMGREPFPFMCSKVKPPGTVRIFVFGESAAYGDPQPEFGLSRMLEALLSGRYPGARFEVINTAMTAINSHAILPIARDCAGQSGDVWVVYMGNNEVVGPYGAGTVFGLRAAGLTFVRANLALKASRIGQSLDDVREHVQRRPTSQAEWRGMEMFMQEQVRQSDPAMATVYANFERNLHDILQAGQRSGAKIVLSTVASNLKDCAPLASLHRPDLQPDELANWNDLYQRGAGEQSAGRPAQAAVYFARAAGIDSTFAELHFRWGWCCLGQGQDAEALRQFSAARDEDTLRFRCDSRLNEIIKQAASDWGERGVLFADAQAALAQQSPHGLIGQEYLYEHVHLNFEGNYLLARTLAEQVIKSLPEAVTHVGEANRSWPSVQDCARRLAWSDWKQYQATRDILSRVSSAPFTAQLNDAEQCQRLQQQLETLLPATGPAALQQDIAECREAIAHNAGDWVLREQLALLCQETGNLNGAVESWRNVVQLLPHFTDGWRFLGGALYRQNQYEDALAAYSQALRLQPDNVYAMDDVAVILLRQGKEAEAMRQYKKALAIKPYTGQAHFGLGMILEKMGKTEEAQPHFQQALKYRVFTPANLNALGQFCLQKGWFAAAATNFTDSLRLNPADPRAHLALGDAFEGLGRQAEAKEQYAAALGQFQRILQSDPTNAVALQWTQVLRKKLPAESPH